MSHSRANIISSVFIILLALIDFICEQAEQNGIDTKPELINARINSNGLRSLAPISNRDLFSEQRNS